MGTLIAATAITSSMSSGFQCIKSYQSVCALINAGKIKQYRAIETISYRIIRVIISVLASIAIFADFKICKVIKCK